MGGSLTHPRKDADGVWMIAAMPPGAAVEPHGPGRKPREQRGRRAALLGVGKQRTNANMMGLSTLAKTATARGGHPRAPQPDLSVGKHFDP